MALSEANQLLFLTEPKAYFSFAAYLAGQAAGTGGRGDAFPYLKLRVTSGAKYIFPKNSRSKTSVANGGRRGWK